MRHRISSSSPAAYVRNIFRKLDAGSRVEVARIVERADRLAGSAGVSRRRSRAGSCLLGLIDRVRAIGGRLESAAHP